jgi:hypothetical protein
LSNSLHAFGANGLHWINKNQKHKNSMGSKKENKAAAETAEASSTSTAVSLFQSSNAVGMPDLSQLKRRNMAQLIKPGDVPVDGVVSGIIEAVVDSPVSTVKGKLFHLSLVSFDEKNKPTKTGVEITFPITGSIRQAIAPGKSDEKELNAALEKEVGNLLILKRCPSKQSGKYKKEMFIFDVYTSKV